MLYERGKVDLHVDGMNGGGRTVERPTIEALRHAERRS